MRVAMEKKRYEHLSESERYELYRLHQKNLSLREIGRSLGRSASTVSRELRRNVTYVGYLPRDAQEMARKRCYKAPKKLDKHPELRVKLLEGLRKRWSPEQIAGRLAMEKHEHTVSHETIYAYIHDSPFGRKHQLAGLLCRNKPRRTKRKARKTQGKIPDRVSIHARLEEINSRKTFGHWEGDLVHFGREKNNLITAVERKSRLLMIVNNPHGKEADKVASQLKDKLDPLKPASLTLDNGLEFAKHADILKTTFFCDPYSSWQKGSVENANGIIRRFLPKKYRGTVTNSMVETIQNIINNTPRKILDFKTPIEVFFNRCTSS
jgi:IS30 family transposase